MYKNIFFVIDLRSQLGLEICFILSLQGFVQNQNRVSNLRDKSILPDLCSSHKKQLVVMVTNHKKLREIKKKCKMAKEELSINLHTRLR